MNYICTTCNKDCKYESLFKRHLNRKIKCIKLENVNQTSNIIQEDKLKVGITKDIMLDKLKNIIINKLSKSDIIDIINSMFDNIENKNIENKNIETKNIETKNIESKNIESKSIETKNIESINIDNIDDKNICNLCNKIYSNRHSLYTHNKLGRCKGIKNNKDNKEILQNNIIPEQIKQEQQESGLSVNDILGITLNESAHAEINNNNNSNNTTNNNPVINNNNTINNITNNNPPITNNITINAFRCENLDHITTKQFKSLFKNFNHLHKILYKLSSLVYIKNSNNMNFTKNNMNKNIVTYLDRDMEVKQISEKEFIKEFEENIKHLCIELFHIHKNDISIDDLIEYMKSFLLFYDNLQDRKFNHRDLKENLKSIMDYVFRDEDINEVIKKIKLDLQKNEELKKKCIKSNNVRINLQYKRLDEYEKIPNEDNDNKNLYKIKNIAITKNREDKIKYLKIIKDEDEDEYNNKEESKIKKDSEIIIPIIPKIDIKNCCIIDDRE